MRVLVIDDERDLRWILTLTLRQLAGFTVDEATNGPEGLARAAEHPPDVVVLDVMMPGMDGPTVLQKLREHPGTASTPVVFLTAKAMPTELERLRGLGAAAVMTKPFRPEELIACLRGIVDQA